MNSGGCPPGECVYRRRGEPLVCHRCGSPARPAVSYGVRAPEIAPDGTFQGGLGLTFGFGPEASEEPTGGP